MGHRSTFGCGLLAAGETFNDAGFVRSGIAAHDDRQVGQLCGKAAVAFPVGFYVLLHGWFSTYSSQ